MKHILIAILFNTFFISNSIGQCYWAKQISSTPITTSPNSETNSLVCDNQGNIYATGMVGNGNFDLNTDAGTSIVSTTGRYAFLEKFDQNGNFLFGKTLQGNGSIWGNSIALDNSGNIILAGTFIGTADFNPGSAVFNLTASNYDGFICSFDSNGNFNWAIKLGGTNAEYLTSIDIDGNNNIIASGYFQGTTDLDPSATVFNLASNGSDDIFIVKLTSLGNFTWAKSLGGTGADRCNAIKHDLNNNYILTGFFNGTVDFDPNAGLTNLTSAGGNDIYLLSLSSIGNLNFALRAGSNLSDLGKSLTIDNFNNLYFTGEFAGIVDFNPGSGVSNLTSTNSTNTNAFILKLSNTGAFKWCKQITGVSTGKGIASDSQGNVVSTGQFSNTGSILADLDPGAGALTYSNNYQNAYFQKLDSLGNLISGLKIGDTSGNEIGNAIASDINDNFIVTGLFSGTTDFDPGQGTYSLSSNFQDIFYFKINEEFPAPLISPGGPITSCQGNSVVLSSSYSTNNNWSTGANSSNISISSSGSYYSTYVDLVCYSSSLPVIVNFNPNPSVPLISVTGSLSYCLGNSVSNTLTSNSAQSYLWSDGSTTQGINVTSAGTYSVTIYDANGCSSNSTPVNIVVNPLPIASAANGGPYCVGNTISLSATGGGTYLWSGPGGFTSTAQNPIRTNSTVAMSGIYTVTVTINGCSSTATTNVLINANPPAPTINNSGPATFCQGQSTTLTSSSASGNTWSTGATSQSITVTSSGSYSVIFTNTNGCFSSSSVYPIIVQPNSAVPTITPDGPLTFCEGNSVVLTSNFPDNDLHYNVWYNGNTVIPDIGDNSYVTITTSGTYYVKHEYTPIGINYCPSNSVPITVTVLPRPSTPSITPIGPLTICQGNSVILNSSSATNNIWSNGSNAQAITVFTPGSYSVQVTDGVCTSLISNNVTISTVAPPVNPLITVNGSLTLCKGEMVQLISNQSSNVLWSNGETTNYVDIYDAGSYSFSVSNGVCPTLTSNVVSVAVNNLQVNISASSQLAENSPNSSITFSANTINSGISPTYQWYKNGLTVGNNLSTYSNNNWVNGEKIVCRVTSSGGCSVFSNDLYVWLAQPTSDSWQRMADVGLDKNMVTPLFPTRIGAVSFTIGDKIYVGLGYNDNKGQTTVPGYLLSDFWEYNTITDEWTERAPFAFGNSPRMNAVAFVVNGRGYVGFGQGNSDLWEYNPQTDSWTQKSSCPSSGGQVACNIGMSGYVGVSNGWWKYTPATDSWTELANLPFSAGGLSCGSVNNRMYISGIYSVGNNEWSINYEYNPENNSWTEKTAKPVKRYYSESFVINDTIFYCGGQSTPNTCEGADTFDDVWAYYPPNDSWVQKSNIHLGKISNGCAASVNGYGYYISGGYQPVCQQTWGFNDAGYGRETNLKYSPSTDSWEVKAVFGGLKSYFGFSTTIGNKGYALFQYGGQSTATPYAIEVYLYEYDPLNNIWKQKSKYPGQGIAQAGNGFSINGKIYYGSGSSSNNVFVTDFWEYDPFNDSWSSIGNVPIAANKGYSFVLNGKGYFGGGPQMGSSFFEFNPNTYTFNQRASTPTTSSGNINFSLNNFGYTNLGTSLYKYDPSINIWTLVNTLPNFSGAAAYNYFSFQTSLKGFYGTGINSTTSWTTSSFIYEFDPTDNTWTQRQSLPENQSFGGSFNFPNNSFVLGGAQNYSPFLPKVNSMWQYKPECSNSASTINESACATFTLNGETFNQTGTYIQTLTNSVGCDSTLTLNLNITDLPNNVTTLTGNTLTAVANGANYQWLDCNNAYIPIMGATNQSFEPVVNGSYAVNINSGACSIISPCTNITLTEVSSLDQMPISIFPNPTSSVIHIQKTKDIRISEVEVFNVLGSKLFSLIPDNNSAIQIEMPIIPGTYFLKILDFNGKIAIFKVVKI